MIHIPFLKRLNFLIIILGLASNALAQDECSGFLFLARPKLSFTVSESNYDLIEVKSNQQGFLISEIMVNPGSHTGSYERFIKNLAEDVTQFLGHKLVKTVFYPAAGSDGVLGFKLFEDARLVIGLDDHPFYLSDQRIISTDIKVLQEQSYGWEFANEIGESRTLAESFFNKLYMRFPEARVLNVLVSKNRRLEGMNAIIDFDLGEGTEIRRYIHVFADSKRKKYLSEMVEEILIQNNIEAVIAKGSMEIFKPGTKDYDTFGKELIDHMINKKGILVDGDFVLEKHEGHFSFSGVPMRVSAVESISDFDTSETLGHGIWIGDGIVFDQTGVTFGYSKTTNLISFE